jgi:hypothetical protein
VRYQGIDWRNRDNWGCNLERNPYGSNYLDGGSLEAMEVMFVKVKQRLLDLGWSYPYAASQYDRWYLARAEVMIRRSCDVHSATAFQAAESLVLAISVSQLFQQTMPTIDAALSLLPVAAGYPRHPLEPLCVR